MTSPTGARLSGFSGARLHRVPTKIRRQKVAFVTAGNKQKKQLRLRVAFFVYSFEHQPGNHIPTVGNNQLEGAGNVTALGFDICYFNYGIPMAKIYRYNDSPGWRAENNFNGWRDASGSWTQA